MNGEQQIISNRKQTKRKVLIILVLCFLFLVLSVTAGLFYIQRQLRLPASFSGIEKIFMVKSGEGVKQIACHLENDGLIRNSFYFEFYVWKEKLSQKLQAGEYLLQPDMTIKEIVDAFAQGRVVSNEIQITIPEGFSVRQIEERLVEAGLVKEGALAISPSASEYWAIYEFLKDLEEGTSLEGFLFPDTYKFYKDATPK
ncbi:unnamed protein product, partial [marine sediment metagenome]